MKGLFFVFLFFLCRIGFAQQNLSFYFLHTVPHTNFLNPAVQSSCKGYLGIPVISSLHVNYGNNMGAIRDFMQLSDLNQDRFLRNMAHTLHVTTELQLNLLSFGIATDDAFWSFAVTDKLEVAAFAPKSGAELIFKGNRAFEGQSADFSISLFSNYYREYSLGWAKEISSTEQIGFHGKLLFGKANISTTSSRSSLYTDPNNFDLSLLSEMKMNSSLPLSLQIDSSGAVQGATSNTSAASFLFNHRNIGFAADAGFIRRTAEDMTWAGSVLDLGIIYWTTSPENYSHNGSYLYTGPLGDSVTNSGYIRDIYNNAAGTLNAGWTNKNYISFLAPRLYLGFKKDINHTLSWTLTGTAKIYRSQIIPGLTAGVIANISKSIVTTASFSYLNRSFKNMGLGLVFGNHPFQFYAVTDNLFGLIYPLRYRTVNLRMGFILKFGCNREKQFDNCGCEWLRQAEEREFRNQRLKHQ